MMPEEGEPEPEPAEPPPAPAPPRPELRFRDLSSPRGCSVCGREREPYVRVEIRGRMEYTCRECATGRAGVACASCGERLETGDRFCGRCGRPTELKCAGCATPHESGDRFCGKCGRAL